MGYTFILILELVSFSPFYFYVHFPPSLLLISDLSVTFSLSTPFSTAISAVKPHVSHLTLDVPSSWNSP
jgi:hypothetical protein